MTLPIQRSHQDGATCPDRRHQYLSAEITEGDFDLKNLVAAAPRMLAMLVVGIEAAGQLLTTAGDNSSQLRSEVSLAYLCDVARMPASSGRTHGPRLNRGDDRAAKNAFYVVVLCRFRYDARTRVYADRRTKEGLSKPEIIRYLKRYVAREVFTVLAAPHSRIRWPPSTMSLVA